LSFIGVSPFSVDEIVMIEVSPPKNSCGLLTKVEIASPNPSYIFISIFFSFSWSNASPYTQV